jgi:hypothetical protein
MVQHRFVSLFLLVFHTSLPFLPYRSLSCLVPFSILSPSVADPLPLSLCLPACATAPSSLSLSLNICHHPSHYPCLTHWQHWTYTLDMVDSYLGVFPDKEAHLLWNAEPVPFYLSPAIVRSRADRYKIVPNSNKPGTSALRVYSAVSCKISPYIKCAVCRAIHSCDTVSCSQIKSTILHHITVFLRSPFLPHLNNSHSTTPHIRHTPHNLPAWSDEDFPAAKKAEMLAIKANPGYMGNPQGEGAIWQRTPAGAEVKVRNTTDERISIVLFLYLVWDVLGVIPCRTCHADSTPPSLLCFISIPGHCHFETVHSRHTQILHPGSLWHGG